MIFLNYRVGRADLNALAVINYLNHITQGYAHLAYPALTVLGNLLGAASLDIVRHFGLGIVRVKFPRFLSGPGGS